MPNYSRHAFHSAVAHVHELLQRANGAVVPIDKSDPKQVDFLEQTAIVNGQTPERYPALFDHFRTATNTATPGTPPAGSDSPFVDGQFIDYMSSLTTGGNATGRGTLTRLNAIQMVHFTMSIVNVTGTVTTVLASGTALGFGSQTLHVQTNDASAQPYPTTGTNSGLMAWSIAYVDGTHESNGSTTPWSSGTTADPTVTAPVINPNRTQGNLQNIMIGLSRGTGTTADVDYWFLQGQVSNSTLLVPFAGSMFFTNPIAPLDAANPSCNFYLARQEGGVNELQNATVPLSCFSINANNANQLDFSLLATATAAGNAINFGTSPWVSNTQTFFTGTITVTFAGTSGIGWSSVLSSTNPDTDPLDGVLYIPPIMFVWHCMVAGTQVLMSDGSTTNIEDLQVGDVVATSGGGTLTVQATLAQPNWTTVFVITTTGGLTITCSGTHPFQTPNGFVQASALATGTVVNVSTAGTDTVSTITTLPQNGDGLFNIWLNGTAGSSTFYANGFLVGDYLVQIALLQNPDPATVLAALPPSLHTDFGSWLEDRPAPRRSWGQAPPRRAPSVEGDPG